MDETEIEGFRKQLLESRAELRRLEGVALESTKPVELDQARVGRLSRMDAMQGQQMALEVARRRKQQLVKIEGALRRIELGTFGECHVCGEPIDLRRLAIDPTNTRCVGCVE